MTDAEARVISEMVAKQLDEFSRAQQRELAAFGTTLVERVVPALVAAMPQQQARSGLSATELQAVVDAVQGYVARALDARLTPLAKRLDVAERSLPGSGR